MQIRQLVIAEISASAAAQIALRVCRKALPRHALTRLTATSRKATVYKVTYGY
jgi:hypothetical protein